MDAQKIEKSALEVGSEDRIPIIDDVGRETMNADDVFHEHGRHVGCRHGFCGFDEDRHLGETAHDDEDRVMVVTGREICDPIQGDVGPRPGRDGQRRK